MQRLVVDGPSGKNGESKVDGSGEVDDVERPVVLRKKCCSRPRKAAASGRQNNWPMTQLGPGDTAGGVRIRGYSHVICMRTVASVASCTKI